MGELAHRLRFPLPAPITGLLLLFALLTTGVLPPAVRRAVEATADLLLRYLLLLFVPVTVGILPLARSLAGLWPILLLVVVGSTLLVLTVTGWLCQRLGGGSAR